MSRRQFLRASTLAGLALLLKGDNSPPQSVTEPVLQFHVPETASVLSFQEIENGQSLLSVTAFTVTSHNENAEQREEIAVQLIKANDGAIYITFPEKGAAFRCTNGNPFKCFLESVDISVNDITRHIDTPNTKDGILLHASNMSVFIPSNQFTALISTLQQTDKEIVQHDISGNRINSDQLPTREDQYVKGSVSVKFQRQINVSMARR